MTFLNPLGLAFLALVPVVVLLYLRRVRRREVVVPALLFWEQAMGERRRRAFLGRLRQWLSLLLSLLILAALVLALARPQPSRLAAGRASAVVILDGRARMQALEPDGRTRFAHAVEIARQAASGAGEGRPVALLVAGASPEVLAPFSADPATLFEALQAAAPADTGGDLDAALSLARELLATRPGGRRIVLVTDGSDAPPPAPDLEVAAVGTSRENAAITRFAVRPELADPRTADVLLEIANFGRERAEGSVEIACDGVLLDVRPYSLEPGRRKVDVFPALPAMERGAGKLTARLTTTDALPLDSIAYAALPPLRPLRALLVTEGNFFLEKLLAADESLKFDLLAPAAFQPAMAANFDVVIYDRCGPESLAGLAGNALFLQKSPFPSSGAMKNPLITENEAESPLFQLVEWRGVHLLKAETLTLPEAAEGWRFQAPLRSFEHPLIATGEKGPQRLAIFAFDVAESDLPLRVAFPLLFSNTLRWLAAREADPQTSLAAGETLPLQPGETAENDGGQRQGTLRPTRNGFYPIKSPSGERWVAVNTLSDAESNLQIKEAPLPGVRWSLAAPGGRPLWLWLALAALALLSAEWWLFHRRHTE